MRGDAQDRRVERHERFLLEGGNDFGAETAGQRCLLDHHRFAGLAHDVDHAFDVEGNQRTEI